MTLTNNIYISEYEILNSIYCIRKVDNNWVLFNKLTKKPLLPSAMFSDADAAYIFYIKNLRSDNV